MEFENIEYLNVNSTHTKEYIIAHTKNKIVGVNNLIKDDNIPTTIYNIKTMERVFLLVDFTSLINNSF